MLSVIDAGELLEDQIVECHEAGRVYTLRKHSCFVEWSDEAETCIVADWLLIDFVALVAALVLELDCRWFVSETKNMYIGIKLL